jgi:phosphoribosylcarboxyaminoimidazole (NCAIR) mutase
MWNLTMGSTQQRARWPMAAQTALKLAASVGVEGAVASTGQQCEFSGIFNSMTLLTVATVQVDNTEHVGRAALSSVVETAARGVGDLAILDDGGGGKSAGEKSSGSDEELHFESLR